MKKTTWAIIGLSLTVLILASALGIVILQRKTEKIINRTPDDDLSGKISSELRQMIGSFYISPRPVNYEHESYVRFALGPVPLKSVIYHNNKIYGLQGVPGLKVYRMGNATTYVISPEK